MALADELFEQEIARIRSLGELEEEPLQELWASVAGLDEPHGKRGFISHAILQAVLPGPLFYDQPLVDLCRYCELAQDVDLLHWMADEELIRPILRVGYGSFTEEQLSAIAGVPHVSGIALHTVRRETIRRMGDACLCHSCVSDQIADYSELGESAEKEIEKVALGHLVQLPVPVQEQMVGSLNTAIASGSEDAVTETVRQIQRSSFLAQAETFGAVPQIYVQGGVPEDGGSPENLARGLGIAYSSDVDPRRYLEVIKDYQGCLSPVFEGKKDVRDLIDEVNRINEEIRGLRTDARYNLFEIGSNVFRKDRRRILEAAITGGLGLAAGGPIGAATGAAIAPMADALLEEVADKRGGSSLKSKAIASYFETSVEAVHVWRIREEL